MTMPPELVATEIRNAKWWVRLFRGRALGEAAADWIDQLERERGKFEKAAEVAKLQAKSDIAHANAEATSIAKRVGIAIREMEGSKRNLKNETAAAVVLSPYQYAILTNYGSFRNKQAEIMGVPIYVAKGVYGPVVLTEDGFNGFSRMAPELHIKAAG